MRKIIIIAGLFISMVALANIDVEGDKGASATATEIATYRSCFQELQKLGCRHPSEDRDHFRGCLSELFSSLSGNCQKMMSTLYGVK